MNNIKNKLKWLIISIICISIILLIPTMHAFADERNDALNAFISDANNNVTPGQRSDNNQMVVYGTVYNNEEPCSVHISYLKLNDLEAKDFMPSTGVLCLNKVYGVNLSPHGESWLCWVDDERQAQGIKTGASIGYQTHYGMINQDRHYSEISRYSKEIWLKKGYIYICNNGSFLYSPGEGKNIYAQNCLWGVRPDELKGEEKTVVKTIVKESSAENNFDNTKKGVIWNFNNPCSTTNYSRTTPIKQLNDINNINATVWTITQTKYYQWEWSNGSLQKKYYDTKYTYTSENFNKTINYNANQPELPKDKYTPFNISRENVGGIEGDSHITSSDLAGYQPGDPNVVGKIDGDTENYSGVTDGSPLSQLDINSDSKFKLSFNNQWYGLDASKNWDNSPPWETGDQKMNPGEEYAKGLNKYISSGNDSFRWELFINGGVTNIGSGSESLTSLIDLNSKNEYPAGTYWESDYAKSGYGTWNNMFGTRAIYNGKYNTTNNNNKTSYQNWWTLMWRQGKYYEYGIHYEGQIRTDGIHAPYQQSYQGITTEFTVNGDEKNGINTLNTNGTTHRGLYVKLGEEYRENPLLTGTWNVSTIAGDLAKTK